MPRRQRADAAADEATDASVEARAAITHGLGRHSRMTPAHGADGAAEGSD